MYQGKIKKRNIKAEKIAKMAKNYKVKSIDHPQKNRLNRKIEPRFFGDFGKK